MDITFEKGSRDQPKGHAILYYLAGEKVLATYLTVLPIKTDLTKYVPPFLAPQVKSAGMEDFSSFPFPPIPEEVANLEYLEKLAELRGDDLIYAGFVREEDPLEAAQQVNDAVQEYTRIYNSAVQAAPGMDASHALPSEPASDLDVGEVMLSLMSERDRLGELAKLVGKLQFAMEGNDGRLMEESKGEIAVLAKYLPQKYHASQIVDAISQPGPHGSRLAQLYLDRCYKIADDDFNGLQQVEQSIKDLLSNSPERP